MVIQDNNFRQIKDFIKMSELYDVVHVQLQIIEPDFHFKTPNYLETWLKKAVHEKTHKNYTALIEVLKDSFFDKYLDSSYTGLNMTMGPLIPLRDGHDISQYQEQSNK